MAEIVKLETARVDLNLTPDELRVIGDLSRRFGISRAAIARALIREGIGRVQRTGSFTVEVTV